jgi:hypothetical protein
MGKVADDVNDTWEIWERWDWVRHVFGVLEYRGANWQSRILGSSAWLLDFV